MHNLRGRRLDAVLFDFGGVLAEEGFREGLKAIARSNGLPPEEFFCTATEAVYSTGYLLGHGDEADYWNLLRRIASIKGSDDELRGELLSRFVLRPWMLDIVRSLRSRDYVVAILSDQTNWLDELDQRDHFFKEFQKVFNSYHLGMSKRNPEIFASVVEELEVPREQTLFIDDSQGHVQRAESMGLITHLYRDRPAFLDALDVLGLRV